MTRVAILQMTSGIDPHDNARAISNGLEQAKAGGAAMLFTPEMALLLDRKKARASDNVVSEEDSSELLSLREAAARKGVWLALGSMPVALADGRWANRSLVIDASGAIAARYDKLHMFDVALEGGESWRESSTYAPGDNLGICTGTPVGTLGLTICYDIRFPALFHELGKHSCDVIATPAAFTVPTGKAHWHLLQRARAVESSAYVIAAAQCGEHEDGRSTYGHSLVVDPWGEVTLDMGAQGAKLAFAEIDPERIASTRKQLPSLANRRAIPD